MKTLPLSLLAAAMLLLAACGAPRAVVAEQDVTRYAGVLSCTFCSGLQTELRIRDNGTYEMRETYASTDDEPERTASTRGQWTLLTTGENGRSIYRLEERETGERRFFERHSSRELRKMTNDMQVPADAGNRSLMRIDN